MPDQETSQEGNIVGGDQAGRDIVKTNVYVNADPARPTVMGRLIAKFKAERAGDAAFARVIERLQHYGSQVPGEEIIGLEPKLEAGGRNGFCNFAQKTKELFTKKLAQHQLSESAQEIHAHLLAEVYTRFHNHVYPLIVSDRPRDEVNRAIQTNVVDPVVGMLEENVLQLYADDINGMLYFLTGNCHIKWVK